MKSLSRSLGRKAKNVMNKKYSVIILLLLVVGGYFLLQWCQNSKLELFSGSSKLYFFFAEWCGHCKNFKPEWQKLKNMSNLGVQFEEVDCSDNRNVPSLAKEHNVRGFPTLILVNGNNNVTYEGNRDAESIAQFIKNNQ